MSAPTAAPPTVPPYTAPAAPAPPARRPRRWPRRLGRALLALVGLGLVAAIAYPLLLRTWVLHWGATDAEIAATLPGDDLVPGAATADQSTRAITIGAPAATVWPWLVQMGQGRGGLYSYAWLENLLGCRITNADRVHPEWQTTQVGDPVRLYPEGSGPPPYLVAAIIPEQALVLGHHPADGAGWTDTWAFVLQPIDARSTRLIIRGRDDGTLGFLRVLEPGTFIMERGMLRGIRDRAEAQ